VRGRLKTQAAAAIASALALVTAGAAAAARPQSAAAEAELRWGGDAEGGAPFVEADPGDPTRLVGFDVEIAEALAAGLGRTPRFVQVTWESIDQSVARGDFDVGLSGVEDTPGRRARFAVTLPYFEFREVLTVRVADADRFRSLADFDGRRVGTLGATMAYEILRAAAPRYGVVPVSYDDDVHPYTDLAMGRLDGVVLDHVLAARAMRRVSGLATHPEAIATGRYIGVLAPGNTALRDRLDEILLERMRDGTLERIFRKWDVWDAEQARFERRVIAAGTAFGSGEASTTAVRSIPAAIRRYLPSLARAAGITVVISCAAMALAVVVGVLIASGRVYGDPVTRALLTVYVEVMRGTPVLLQLFVIYYGFSTFVRLPAFSAAIVGLALNYAAYESEIYRGALEAVPKGQLEAARTLGLTEGQVLWLVRVPQAFRLALAPMTNDFVALLKDSSLVSVITVVELTKQTSIFASNSGSWLLPGVLCGALYLVMSLPLGRLARRLELRWKAPTP
jgi:polar amino acid transport system substrate-binding protein